MKLHITPNSPYARMARIVIIEKGLQDQIEVVLAKTRTPDSPYYGINPSGRVPFLECDDGPGYEDSPLICRYLDYLDGKPTLHPVESEEGWEVRRLAAMARSMLDGLALWGREFLYRPDGMRSQTIIDHEMARCGRMCDAFETEMDNPHLTGPLNIAQITLGCALTGSGSEERFGPDWCKDHPKLAAWAATIAVRPSFEATRPVVLQH